MKIAYDGAYAPSAQQAACLRQTGEVYFGYLNTPGVYHPWTDADFAVVRAAGFTVIPVAFGIRDTSAMLAILECRRLGFTSCVVDCEANDNGAYLGSWSAAIRAAGITPILYGLPGICRAWAGHFVALWAARYGGDPGTNVFDGGIGQPQGWQWWNSHTECGASVDRSWVDDWFAGVGTRDIPSPSPAPPGDLMSAEADNLYRALTLLARAILDKPPLGPDMDWEVANAHGKGAGLYEFGIDDLLNRYQAQIANLHAVAVSGIPVEAPEVPGPPGPQGDPGAPGAPGSPGGGTTVPAHTHRLTEGVTGPPV